MEVDSMARLVPLPGKFLLIVFSTIMGCNAPVPTVPSHSLLINKNEQGLVMQNGLLLINNAPFSGTVYTLFPGTKDTAEIAGYKDGKENGEWKKYYASGKIREKRYFINGQKTGEYLAWWENGNLQIRYFFTADEYDGTCSEWNTEGRLIKKMNYKAGHEDGRQQSWYDNGKVKANYIIKEGRRFGLLGTKNCINVTDSIFNKQ